MPSPLLPPGWTMVETESDEFVRVFPSTANVYLNLSPRNLVWLFIGTVSIPGVTAIIIEGWPWPLFGFYIGAYGAGVGPLVLWRFLLREEWRVGWNVLEVHRSLCGLRWVRRYTDAMLVLRIRGDSFFSGRPQTRQVLWVQVKKRRRRLTVTPPWLKDSAQSVGQFLSRYTGWPLTTRSTYRYHENRSHR